MSVVQSVLLLTGQLVQVAVSESASVFHQLVNTASLLSYGPVAEGVECFVHTKIPSTATSLQTGWNFLTIHQWAQNVDSGVFAKL